MKETLLLTKILLKSSFNINNNKKGFGFGKLILYILVYGYIAGLFSYVSYMAISQLMLFNQEILFVNLCFSGIIVFGVIHTLFTSLNLLYFSKDIENLLPLPISPIKIIMAKFNCLIVAQYFIILALLVPVLIVYGVLLKCNMLYYLIAVIVSLLIPVVPVLLSSLLIIIVMKFTKIIKSKEAVQYVSVFCTIVLIIIMQAFFGSTDKTQVSDAELAEMLISQSDAINNSSQMFFTIKPALNSILNYNNLEGLKSLIILSGETLLVYFVICSIVSKTYIKTVTKFSSMGNKKGKKLDTYKDFEKSKLWKTYLKKEFKLLVRNPIFFMQCVLPSIIFPAIFSLPIFVAVKDSDPDIMKIYTEFLSGDINTSIGVAVILIIILMLYMFNFIAITAISREGKDSVFMKRIPVPLYKQVLYKILPGIILNIIPLIYVIFVAKVIVKGLNFDIIIFTSIIATLCNILNNYLMILIDLKNPKLNWTTEYAVVKQNFNMIFQFIIMVIQAGIIIAICSYFNLQNSIICLIVLFSIAIAIVIKYIKTNENKIFSKIN